MEWDYGYSWLHKHKTDGSDVIKRNVYAEILLAAARHQENSREMSNCTSPHHRFIPARRTRLQNMEFLPAISINGGEDREESCTVTRRHDEDQHMDQVHNTPRIVNSS